MCVDGYDAVVYDLDGTLARLAVDWDAAERDGRAVFADHGIDSAGDLWSMLTVADEHGLREEFEAVLQDHERAGARESTRCPRADDLPLSVPVGVCSLNCADACHIALERHALAEHVDCVVGRDSVTHHKPHPEPLLTAVRELGVAPGDALFVGDSRRDEETADTAGVDFDYAGDGPTQY